MANYLYSGNTLFAGETRGVQIVGVRDEMTAMIGRTLRGPLNTPVQVQSFAQFKRIFGGLWERSVLSYCVAQYFDNGGAGAMIVRVANAPGTATLALPCDDDTLQLRAVDPGRHECIRAAVDYDGIESGATERFNLTLQRVRDYQSEEVTAQEIFANIGLDPDAPRCVRDVLARSRIARLARAPLSRPAPTRRMTDTGLAYYRYAALDGDDGLALRDADVLGSGAARNGLFALGKTDEFTQLYLPPLTFDVDIGVAVLRAAARLCAKRDALLICDARREWRSVSDALYGAERLSLRSANAALYFPRYWVGDERSSRLLPPGAAVAGVLARLTREQGPDGAPAGRRAVVRNVRSLAVRTTEAQSYKLAELGVNCLRRGPGGRRVVWDARTLVDPDAVDKQSLRVRRLALYLTRSIRQGCAAWTELPPDTDICRLVVGHVERFLHREFIAGCFRGATPDSAYFARCRREQDHDDDAPGVPVMIEFGFAPLAPGRFVVQRLSLRVGLTGAGLPAAVPAETR